MKRTSAKVICGVLTAAMAATGLTACGDSTVVDGTQTALVINDEEINLGKANFMLRYQQATMASYYETMSSMLGQEYSLSFDALSDESDEDSPTVGENLKEDALTSIEQAFLMRQHASEYDVALTDEEVQGAKDAAAAFVEDNDAETLTKLGVTQEDIEDVMQVYAIQSKMYDPMIADVDTEVSDEEAQQSSISYVQVSTEGTQTDENGETVELTDEEKAEKKEIAQTFLDRLNASEDPATADFSDLRTEINDELNAQRRAEEAAADTAEDGTDAAEDSTDEIYLTASETTFGADDEDLDEALKEAAQTLSDGQVYAEVIEGENAYYVVRMNSVLDREATDSQKETIVQERQAEAYSNQLDTWVEESDISVKRAWNKLEVTDYDLYTMTVDTSEESTDGTTDSTSDSESSTEGTDSTSAESSAEGTDSTSAESSAENTDSTTESTADTDSSSESTAE
ncbi:MAG: peptidylprolyl isomerase [Lacrimispora saccharolytica]